MVRRSELLQRLKSLGPAFATTLTQEVFYKDFRNRREVASYFGLAPTDRDQGISKAGNPRARCSAVELSWLWLRHQPGSELTKWYRQRTLKAGKRIAIVALARKLVVALWRYLTTGLVPAGAVLKPAKGPYEGGLMLKVSGVAERPHDCLATECNLAVCPATRPRISLWPGPTRHSNPGAKAAR
jgi:hypothetical protein